MFAKIYKCGLVLIISLLLFCASWNEANADQKAFIVVFDQSINEIQKEAIIKKFDGIIVKDLKIINGKAIILDEAKAFDFSKAPGVMRLTADGFIQLDSPMKQKSVVQATQVVPWGVEATGAESLGKIVTTKVDVAIMDTGIDLEHPDLKENIAGGINIVDPSVQPMDIDGHGTQVAGIVAGVNNKTGILGVAPKASLYPVCVFRKSGNSAPIAFYSDIIAGLEWCAANRMKVVNISFGSYVDDPNIREAVAKAISAGVVIVASAGNNGSSNPFFPASYPDVISVSAVDIKGNIANWSNFGPGIDLAAPGVDILTTSPQGKYIELSGTDFSAPHVTGAMALALAVNIKPQKAIEILFDKAQDAGNNGKDDYYGYGMVDAKKTAYSAWWQIPLKVNAKAFPVVGNLPLTVSFSGEVLSGPPTKPVFYKWDFDNNKINDFTNVISAETAYMYTHPGVYIAILQVTDFLGKTATDFVTIVVKLPYSVDLIADPEKGYTPLSVDFQANLTGNAIVKSYDWDFDGDGTYEFSSGKTPTATHVYETEGIYQPMVKLTDVFGNFVTDFTEVNVKPPLNVEAFADPDTGEASLDVNLSATITGGSGTIALIEWDFESDGIIDYTDGVDVLHTYPVEGLYSATIKVTDDWGGTASDSVEITVINPFKLSLSADPTQTHTLEDITFTAVPTNGALPISYEWDFDSDGVFDQFSGDSPVIKHAYSASGVYIVTVKGVDANNRNATASTQVEVMPPVTVSLSAEPTRVHTNENISFTAEASGGFPPLVYQWDFDGDGIFEANSENNVIDHSYPEAKVYTVTVKVVDNIDGPRGTATASVQVDVKPPLTVKLFADPTRVHTNNNISFTASASGGFAPITYEWDFNGDGVFEQSSGNINVANHLFNTQGTYTVTVKATDDIDGTNGTAFDSVQLEVRDPLTVALSVNKPIVHVFDGITFTATPNGGFTPINYSWDFNNDGVFEQSSGTNPTIIHSFSNAGIYKVNVKAIDDIDGPKGTATAQITVEVRPPLLVDLVANPSSGRIPLDTELTASVQNGIPPVTYTWDLDNDGIFETDTGNVPKLNNTFNDVGTYLVWVKATDDSGSTRGVKTKSVFVTAYLEDYVFHTKWGTCGSGEGQFDSFGIAIDESGYIYAADSGNYRIQKFGPQGTFITQWGSKGSGPGQFGQIRGIGVDKFGKVYAIEGISTQRIQIFDSIGNYLGVLTPPSIQPKPLYSNIAFDSSNNIYLSDAARDRILVLDSNYQLIKTIGSSGTFDTPREVVFDGLGNIYVNDSNNDRIQKFDPDGKFLAIIGSRGFGNGKFALPAGLALDDSGNIFVTDFIFNNVQKFDPDGNFVTNWGGAGSNDGQFDGPGSIVIDKLGYIYIGDAGNCRIQKFRKGDAVIPPLDVTAKADKENITIDDEVNYSADFIGAPVKFEWFFNRPPCDDDQNPEEYAAKKVVDEIIEGFVEEKIVRAENGYVCEADYTSEVSPDTTLAPWGGCSFDATIKVTDDYGQTATSTLTITIKFKYTFVKKWGSEGGGNGQFWNGGMLSAIDKKNGWLYIVDTNNQRIQKFDLNGNFLSKWGSLGSGPYGFRVPWGIAVDDSGNVYVADSNNHRIMKYNSNAQYVRTWGSEGTDDGKFKYPCGVAVDKNGYVYVSESTNHRVQKFDSNGNFIKKWGSQGSGDGQFLYPRDLAVDSFNNVYVADGDNNRIQKFDSNGNFIKKFGTYGFKSGQFSWDRALGIDSLDRIYVVDFSNNRIQVFDSDGNYITQWGCYGTGNGQFHALSDVAIDSSGVVYVTDAGFMNVANDLSVQKFAPPELIPPTPDCNYTLYKKWGTQGNGDNQLNEPFGVTVDSAGYVYVVDMANDRIVKFGANGTYLLQWGSNGIENGKFDSPRSIAVVGTSDVFVVDSLNNRIQVFDASGEFQRTWGTQGSGNGQFNLPDSIAADSLGNIYVTDSYNNRVQKFDFSGNYLLQWGSIGNGNKQFNGPAGIAIDPFDNVYVVDVNNKRIQKFDKNGNYLLQWGTGGAGIGQFQYPAGVAVDKLGDVYVTDYINSRVQKYSPNGTFIAQWGILGALDGQFDAPKGIYVDDLGYVYVTDMLNYRIQKFVCGEAKKPPIEVTVTTEVPSGDVPLYIVFNVSFTGAPILFEWDFEGDGTYDYTDKLLTYAEHIYATPGKYNTTVRITDDYGTTATYVIVITATGTCNYVFNKKWGTQGNGDNQFNKPFDVTVDTAGYVYVVDQLNDRIVKFDANGTYLLQWGGNGKGNGKFDTPRGIAVFGASDVFVVDEINNRIQVFDTSGVFKRTWGVLGFGNGQFDSPESIAIDSEGNVYVTDYYNDRVQKFNFSGTYLLQWGSTGNGDKQFNGPTGIAIDSSDNVYVTDSNNHRIQKFDKNGNYLLQWGAEGSGIGQFKYPIDVAVDKLDDVYVTDILNNRVQKFDSKGIFISQWGTQGTGNGQFVNPRGIYVDYLGYVYVADMLNNRIQKFACSALIPVAPPFVALDKRAEQSFMPEKTALLQNYPNPFNPETWIPYQLKEDSEVNITIYNSAGQLIRRLELGYKPAGIYATQSRAEHWDGTNEFGERVSSGVYFYNIQAGKYFATKKMIILQ